MKQLFTLIFFFGIHTLNAQSKGYTDLQKIHEDFVKILKSKDWEEINLFVKNITPDEATLAYMKANKISHGSMTEPQAEFPFLIQMNRLVFLNAICLVRYKREEFGGELREITFIKLKNQRTEVIKMGAVSMEVAETEALLKYGNEEVTIKLSEFGKINGVWKAFSSPRINL